ncbi:methyl-accepting chemotaxis protein [Shewanella zhangzhouensis]|uniref:methyl-accepting chemotaxis protein n=1 Tax=Shewanella zhangzhouensis TaxID=2864213 RepID=UPI001C6623E7|nr:methyl-accepting chemotaxis protein [Shewanella zhangzhouensis]QYK07215.1 cache domain-containing protein [Shewanella zhangzhouensis]
MSNYSLRNKLLLLAMVPLVLILTAVMSYSWQVESQALDDSVALFKEELVNERQQQLKEATQIALAVVDHQISLGQNGNINDALRPLRFGSAGYFFIYDYQGANVFHATNPALEGTPQIGMTDPQGTKIVVGLIDAAKRGGGFFNYVYPKPGVEGLVVKIGYAAPIPGKDWLLGTGAYLDDIDAAVDAYSQSAHQAMLEKALAISMMSLVLAFITLIAIWSAAHRMVKPIRAMVDSLNDIAKGEGDLTARLSVRGEDEIAELGTAFNQFVDKLQGIIRDVADTTGRVKQAAVDIDRQTSEMANQLNSHNNETDQVVTAITEMSSTAAEVAQNTTQVAEATHAATGDVAKAQACVDSSLAEISNLMSQVNDAAANIQSLSEQSKKINSVLSVIGGIAEQTNLLALNAAIEAARAGEQGRGFAVVADEVRNLASRTQASTLEINEMLTDLHRLVSSAVKTMDESQHSCQRSVEASTAISESLGSVTSAVTAINDMSTQIAAAATEQSSVTEEINRNVYAIQEIVNALLASSQEARTVSRTVSTEGAQLSKLVGQFKV